MFARAASTPSAGKNSVFGGQSNFISQSANFKNNSTTEKNVYFSNATFKTQYNQMNEKSTMKESRLLLQYHNDNNTPLCTFTPQKNKTLMTTIRSALNMFL
jgi:hypothetical protein